MGASRAIPLLAQEENRVLTPVASAMHVDQLRHHLESAEQARSLLSAWQIRDLDRGWRNLGYLARSLSPETLRELCHPLGRILPRCPDPDMALNGLERFLEKPAGRDQFGVCALLCNSAPVHHDDPIGMADH